MTDEHTSPKSPASEARKRILLVEDEILIALGTAGELEDAGYEVVIALDGVQALEAVRVQTAFDLVITDYMMPHLHGLAMIATMRNEGLTLPIILATSIGEDRLMPPEGRSYDAYVSKPYRSETLLAHVQRLAGATRPAPRMEMV